ncbi:hypothetical protein H4I96_08436 [Botrytis cinerea]
MQLTSSSQSKSPAYHHLSMPSLSLEFLSTFFSLLISSHRNVHRFYPHILASSSFLSPPPNTHTNLSQPQPLRNPTLNFFTHPKTPSSRISSTQAYSSSPSFYFFGCTNGASMKNFMISSSLLLSVSYGACLFLRARKN